MTAGASSALQGRVAAVTGAASGIGRACAEALVGAGASVVLIDRQAQALQAVCEALGPAAHPVVLDLLDAAQCARLVPEVLRVAGRLDILHANAGVYLGGELVDASHEAIDRLVQLNVGVVMKNVRDAVAHMRLHGGGDIVVTSSLAAHFPTPWEPVYAASKWAIDCFVQTTRRQVFRHGIRVGALSPGPVVTGLLADWPADKLAQARAEGSLIEPQDVAQALLFMLSRPRGLTVRDIILMPSAFDL
ncbi:MAG: ribitol 2-dehydrogenase [Caldimonas sp.]|uniref:SDR family oxidoreductase n=1 Tax=Caldimonas TaxID=196013 RepID=UPI00036F61D5|nr:MULTISPECIES: SDR family oxidoreductase [Caldimonas]GIX23436.1 MAG: ribitol 2-dehydrogenase [Caldimonas sp.]